MTISTNSSSRTRGYYSVAAKRRNRSACRRPPRVTAKPWMRAHAADKLATSCCLSDIGAPGPGPRRPAARPGGGPSQSGSLPTYRDVLVGSHRS